VGSILGRFARLVRPSRTHLIVPNPLQIWLHTGAIAHINAARYALDDTSDAAVAIRAHEHKYTQHKHYVINLVCTHPKAIIHAIREGARHGYNAPHCWQCARFRLADAEQGLPALQGLYRVASASDPRVLPGMVALTLNAELSRLLVTQQVDYDWYGTARSLVNELSNVTGVSSVCPICISPMTQPVSIRTHASAQPVAVPLSLLFASCLHIVHYLWTSLM
jgi:hypothetical protein